MHMWDEASYLLKSLEEINKGFWGKLFGSESKGKRKPGWKGSMEVVQAADKKAEEDFKNLPEGTGARLMRDVGTIKDPDYRKWQQEKYDQQGWKRKTAPKKPPVQKNKKKNTPLAPMGTSTQQPV